MSFGPIDVVGLLHKAVLITWLILMVITVLVIWAGYGLAAAGGVVWRRMRAFAKRWRIA